LQEALTDAQTSGNNTEIFLPADDYTVSTVASLTTAAGQNVTISGAGRGTTHILALSIRLGASCSFNQPVNHPEWHWQQQHSHICNLDGSSSFPAINKFVNCFFWNGETGLLIGDGTNSDTVKAFLLMGANKCHTFAC